MSFSALLRSGYGRKALQFKVIQLKAVPLAVLLASGLFLSACASYEPRQLVPSITLSPEDIVLSTFEGSSVQRGGVNFGMVTAINESDSLTNISILPGVRVRSVTPGGAAALAGIRAGDVILSIDQRETNHPDLIDALALQTVNEQTFNFEVRRNTTVFAATVTARPAIDERVAPVELYRADPVATRAGYTTDLLQINGQHNLAGARIVEIFEQSPLSDAGLLIGDTIIAVNNIPVESAQGFINLIHNNHQLGDTVTLTVARDQRVSDRRLQLWDPGRKLSRLSLWPLVSYESTLTPQRTRLTILDLWLISLFDYQHVDGEKTYNILGLFRVASGYGDLQEEQ